MDNFDMYVKVGAASSHLEMILPKEVHL